MGINKNNLRYFLFNQAAEILPTHNRNVRKCFERVLTDRKVRIYSGDPIVEVSAKKIKTANGEKFEVDEILWVTAAGAPSWPADAELQIDKDGFIQVKNTLQSVSHPNIFAVGDVATMLDNPRPKSQCARENHLPAICAVCFSVKN